MPDAHVGPDPSCLNGSFSSSADLRLPLAILAGTDSHPPRRGSRPAPLTPLTGPKALTIAFRGRRLLDCLLERIHRLDYFSPIWIVGSQDLYGTDYCGVPVVDVSGTFSHSLRTAVLSVSEMAPSSDYLALMTSDILPTSKDLRLVTTAYERTAASTLNFWYPLIPLSSCKVPLGPAGSKRHYRVRPDRRRRPVEALPGHLLVIRPSGLNLPLLFTVSEFAYRSRTRAIIPRLLYLIAATLPRITRDLARTASGLQRWNQLVSLLWNGLSLGVTVQTGTATLASLSRRLHSIFGLNHTAQNSHGKVIFVPAPTLALDLDTVEEVQWVGGRVDSGQEG